MADPSGNLVYPTMSDYVAANKSVGQETQDPYVAPVTSHEAMETDQQPEEEEEDQESRDAYAYAKRDEFTSEIYKMEIRGVPKFFPPSQLKKLLAESMQLNVKKIKPSGSHKDVCYATFADETSLQKAIVLLDGYKWKGKTLSTSLSTATPDPLVKIIQKKASAQDTYKATSADVDQLPMVERVTKMVTPYAHMEYEKQLEAKSEAAHNILKKIGREIAKINPALDQFVHFQKMRRKGAVCEMDPIIPSPLVDGYRNKCEFTIGVNSETDERTVGFRVASYKEGNVSVAPVGHLKHISEIMKNVVTAFEVLVRASSHAPFDPVSHTGVWRQLTIRTTNQGDCMLIVSIHPQKLDNEQLEALKQQLVQFCEGEEQTTPGVTSLYVVSYGQRESGVEDEYAHLWGETHITELLLAKKFRISPQAFFQVNTPAAEKLYEKVGEYVDVDGTSVLIDVCCGTGSIGISLADNVFHLYGLEIVEEAVEDARYNASLNGLTNTDFLEGNCEQTLPSLFSSFKGLEVKAIMDPPRAGLPASVISTVRRHEEVTKLVYMACDPNKAHLNFQSIARPISKQVKGQYFVPIRAVAVDLFPHTDKFELVVLWERWEDLKWDRIMEGNPRPRDEAYFKRIPEMPSQESYIKEWKDKKAARDDTKYPRNQSGGGGGPMRNRGNYSDSWRPAHRAPARPLMDNTYYGDGGDNYQDDYYRDDGGYYGGGDDDGYGGGYDDGYGGGYDDYDNYDDSYGPPHHQQQQQQPQQAWGVEIPKGKIGLAGHAPYQGPSMGGAMRPGAGLMGDGPVVEPVRRMGGMFGGAGGGGGVGGIGAFGLPVSRPTFGNEKIFGRHGICGTFDLGADSGFAGRPFFDPPKRPSAGLGLSGFGPFGAGRPGIGPYSSGGGAGSSYNNNSGGGSFYDRGEGGGSFYDRGEGGGSFYDRGDDGGSFYNRGDDGGSFYNRGDDGGSSSYNKGAGGARGNRGDKWGGGSQSSGRGGGYNQNRGGGGGNASNNRGGNNYSNRGGNSFSNRGGNASSTRGGNASSNRGGNASSNRGGNASSNRGGGASSNRDGNNSINRGGNNSGNASNNRDGNASSNRGGQSFNNRAEQSYNNRSEQSYNNPSEQSYNNRGEQSYNNRGEQSYNNCGGQNSSSTNRGVGGGNNGAGSYANYNTGTTSGGGGGGNNSNTNIEDNSGYGEMNISSNVGVGGYSSTGGVASNIMQHTTSGGGGGGYSTATGGVTSHSSSGGYGVSSSGYHDYGASSEAMDVNASSAGGGIGSASGGGDVGGYNTTTSHHNTGGGYSTGTTTTTSDPYSAAMAGYVAGFKDAKNIGVAISASSSSVADVNTAGGGGGHWRSEASAIPPLSQVAYQYDQQQPQQQQQQQQQEPVPSYSTTGGYSTSATGYDSMGGAGGYGGGTGY